MLRVERAAHAIFAAHEVDLNALHLPHEFEEHVQWTMACVAEVQDRVVGMARLSRLDPRLLSLDQVSVDPDYAGHGNGRRLLMEVAATARQLGYEALTGTTFRDVAFNGPFYATLGCVEDPDPHPAMRRQRGVERDWGLDQFGERIIMPLTL